VGRGHPPLYVRGLTFRPPFPRKSFLLSFVRKRGYSSHDISDISSSLDQCQKHSHYGTFTVFAFRVIVKEALLDEFRGGNDDRNGVHSSHTELMFVYPLRGALAKKCARMTNEMAQYVFGYFSGTNQVSSMVPVNIR